MLKKILLIVPILFLMSLANTSAATWTPLLKVKNEYYSMYVDTDNIVYNGDPAIVDVKEWYDNKPYFYVTKYEFHKLNHTYRRLSLVATARYGLGGWTDNVPNDIQPVTPGTKISIVDKFLWDYSYKFNTYAKLKVESSFPYNY